MLPGGLEAAHNAPLRQRPLAQRCCAWTFAPHFQKFCSAMQRNTFMPTARSRDTEVAGSCRPRRLPQSSGHCARPVLPLGLEQRRACTRASAGTLAVRGGKPFAGANQGTTLQRSRCSADCAPRNLPRAPPPPRSCALETRAPQRRNTVACNRNRMWPRLQNQPVQILYWLFNQFVPREDWKHGFRPGNTLVVQFDWRSRTKFCTGCFLSKRALRFLSQSTVHMHVTRHEW